MGKRLNQGVGIVFLLKFLENWIPTFPFQKKNLQVVFRALFRPPLKKRKLYPFGNNLEIHVEVFWKIVFVSTITNIQEKSKNHGNRGFRNSGEKSLLLQKGTRKNGFLNFLWKNFFSDLKFRFPLAVIPLFRWRFLLRENDGTIRFFPNLKKSVGKQFHFSVGAANSLFFFQLFSVIFFQVKPLFHHGPRRKSSFWA